MSKLATPIKKNDTVTVMTGKDRGKQGRVLIARPRERRVIVEGRRNVAGGTTQVASTTLAGARSMVYGGAGLLNLGTTYTLNLRTNLGNNWTATSTPTVKVKVVAVLGMASASCVTT